MHKAFDWKRSGMSYVGSESRTPQSCIPQLEYSLVRSAGYRLNALLNSICEAIQSVGTFIYAAKFSCSNQTDLKELLKIHKIKMYSLS
jgi:hypothetical protein